MSCGCGPTISGQGGGSGPPGPPGPPGGCADTVVVEASDPFATLPAPVAGVITLAANTFYQICGIVDIGPNSLEGTNTTVVSGRDPLQDGITRTQLNPGPILSFPAGGTVRDLSVIATQITVCIRFGAAGVQPPAAENCVVWNCALTAQIQGEQIGGTGILFRGAIGQAVISRISAVGLDSTVRQALETPLGVSFIVALYCNQIATRFVPPGSRQIYLEGGGSQVAASACYYDGNRQDTGIEITGEWFVCQFWGCFTSNEINSSAILDVVTGAVATTGTANQSEAVAMVGYDNSTTRGDISVFQPGIGIPTVTPVGAYVPVGAGSPLHPLYNLGSSSVKFVVDGATTATQRIRYTGTRPYVAVISVAVTVALAAGFITAARTIGSRLLRNGIVLPDSTWEGGFTPGAVTVTAGSIAFSYGVTLNQGDEIQLQIANLGPGPGNLVVTGAEISIA